MNKLATVVIGAVAVLALILGLSPEKAQNLVTGSVTSPDISSPYISFGDVRHWAAQDSDLTQATTTVCALQSPASTSTLQFGDAKFVVASSTQNSTITLAKATTPYATTTLLGKYVIASGAQGTVIASTSPTTGDAVIFSPNTYFVVGMQGGGGTFSPTGNCSAVWIEN